MKTNQLAALPKLPPELLLQVIDSGLPRNTQLILSANDIVTKTLLSWTVVSRATYAHASKQLRERCVYLDSSRRLANLLLCLPRVVPTLPLPLPLNHITSMYLAPFGKTLDDQPTAMWVRELFFAVSSSLTRLVVEMPFKTLDRMSDHLSVRNILREGFASLNKLQEFVSLGDFPSLRIQDGQMDIWRHWPDIQRLAVFGAPLNARLFWVNIVSLRKLDTLVLAKAQHVLETNMKKEYVEACDASLDRDIKVMLMDVAYDVRDVESTDWEKYDPEDRIVVQMFEVPTSYYGDESALEVVTSWVKRGAVQGTLWEWNGGRVR